MYIWYVCTVATFFSSNMRKPVSKIKFGFRSCYSTTSTETNYVKIN